MSVKQYCKSFEKCANADNEDWCEECDRNELNYEEDCTQDNFKPASFGGKSTQ